MLASEQPLPPASRLAIMVGSLAIALLAHLVTGGQWSVTLSGTAAIILVLSALPALSWLVKPVVTYLGIWLLFNLARARADNTAWADQVLGFVPRLEAQLIGGRLPSAVLQDRFYDPGAPGYFDYGWTGVYLSFFVVPHLVALILLWRDRETFWHYVSATGVLFTLALGGFFLMPTSPPWMVTEAVPEADFSEIRRITEEVLIRVDLPVRLFNHSENGTGRMSEVRLEPNSIAAMPSIHFAVTALMAYIARRSGPILYGAALVYTCLMGIALIYLGEHYVLDLAVGGVLAGTGWAIAGKWIERGENA
jgi:membrane-associated phospholipid phosphatase